MFSPARNAPTRLVTMTLKSGKVTVPDFWPSFWVKRMISVILPGTAHITGLSDKREEEAFPVVTDGRGQNSSFIFFVRKCYLQYAGCGWRGHHGYGCHTYLIPTNYDLEHVVAFAYGASLVIYIQAETSTEKRSSLRSRRYRRNGEIRACRWRERRRFCSRKYSICRGFWLEDTCFFCSWKLVCSLWLSKILRDTSVMVIFPHFESSADTSRLLWTITFADH